MVIQSQPSAAGSKDSIFFAQVIDRILLLLVHPAGHSDQDEPDGVKDFCCFTLQGLLCPWRRPSGSRSFSEIEFLDTTALPTQILNRASRVRDSKLLKNERAILK